jgi:transposase
MTMPTTETARAHDGAVSEPDPAARPRRRSFTAEYKAAIVQEYDALAAGSPERGALLRREALYSSHISEWRRAMDAGALDGLAAKPRQRRSPEQIELEKLRTKTERLEAELERKKVALEIMGKAQELLEMLSESSATATKSKP